MMEDKGKPPRWWLMGDRELGASLLTVLQVLNPNFLLQKKELGEVNRERRCPSPQP